MILSYMDSIPILDCVKKRMEKTIRRLFSLSRVEFMEG